MRKMSERVTTPDGDTPSPIVIVKDGTYVMGNLHYNWYEHNPSMGVMNAIQPPMPGAKGVAVPVEDRDADFKYIKPKAEDYRRQIQSDTRRVDGREVEYIVFPDFKIRVEKLAPIIERLLAHGVHEIQYSNLQSLISNTR